jgi:hypothetical protein
MHTNINYPLYAYIDYEQISQVSPVYIKIHRANQNNISFKLLA